MCLHSMMNLDVCFRLIIGYVFHPDGSMDTVSGTDFELWRLGQDGNDPTHFNFTFTAGQFTIRMGPWSGQTSH